MSRTEIGEGFGKVRTAFHRLLQPGNSILRALRQKTDNAKTCQCVGFELLEVQQMCIEVFGLCNAAITNMPTYVKRKFVKSWPTGLM